MFRIPIQSLIKTGTRSLKTAEPSYGAQLDHWLNYPENRRTGTSVLFIYLQKFCDLDKTTMPRKARIDSPSAQHQTIIDRTERKAIFKDNADRTNSIERLDRIISESETGC